MFLLGLVIITGTAIYCALTGDWPSDKYTVGPAIAFIVGTWCLFAPVRRFIYGEKLD